MDQRLADRGGRTMVVLGAQELTVADAARLAGLTPCAVRHRLRIGWPIGQALTKPMAPNVGDDRCGNYRGKGRRRAIQD
jgi:hypothetical protein